MIEYVRGMEKVVLPTREELDVCRRATTFKESPLVRQCPTRFTVVVALSRELMFCVRCFVVLGSAVRFIWHLQQHVPDQRDCLRGAC